MLSKELATLADQFGGHVGSQTPIGPAELAEIEAFVRDCAARAQWLEALAVRPEGRATGDAVEQLRCDAIRAAAPYVTRQR